MSETLRCDVVTPTKLIFSDEADFVSIPAAEGEMGIMSMHAPVVTTLGAGEIRVKQGEDQVHRFAAAGGYAEIEGSKVIIMADRALCIDDVDQAYLNGLIEDYTKRLDEYPEGDSRRVFVQDELEWNKLIQRLIKE